jgi:hypothetical protein
VKHKQTNNGQTKTVKETFHSIQASTILSMFYWVPRFLPVPLPSLPTLNSTHVYRYCAKHIQHSTTVVVEERTKKSHSLSLCLSLPIFNSPGTVLKHSTFYNSSSSIEEFYQYISFPFPPPFTSSLYSTTYPRVLVCTSCASYCAPCNILQQYSLVKGF